MEYCNKRLTVVSYSGDLREATLRLGNDGGENYRGQRYTVDYLNSLGSRLDCFTYITGLSEGTYDEVLKSGIRVIGAGFDRDFDHQAIVKLVAMSAPSALILRTPSLPLMRWARANAVPTMLVIADSFAHRSWRSQLAGFMMARILRAPTFEVVANHGIRAAQQLVALGISAAKVVPWDYPAFSTPYEYPPKKTPRRRLRLFYAGMVVPAKGVLDIVEAVARLRDRGIDATLEIAGKGDVDLVRREADRLCIADRVVLLGIIPNSEMIPKMASVDVVVVPSRHEYPEGMPLTIYEALCSRTPLIVSDHPMFVDNVVDGESALIFRAGDDVALADTVARLASDQDLYARLSEKGAVAWEQLQLPVKWRELIEAWVFDGTAGMCWISENSLVSRR